jgi:hypothetical protein
MAQARAPVAVIYTCALLTGGALFVFLGYEGLFDGMGGLLTESLKDFLRWLLS